MGGPEFLNINYSKIEIIVKKIMSSKVRKLYKWNQYLGFLKLLYSKTLEHNVFLGNMDSMGHITSFRPTELTTECCGC